jgi:hypothetical protein
MVVRAEGGFTAADSLADGAVERAPVDVIVGADVDAASGFGDDGDEPAADRTAGGVSHARRARSASEQRRANTVVRYSDVTGVSIACDEVARASRDTEAAEECSVHRPKSLCAVAGACLA